MPTDELMHVPINIDNLFDKRDFDLCWLACARCSLRLYTWFGSHGFFIDSHLWYYSFEHTNRDHGTDYFIEHRTAGFGLDFSDSLY